MEENKQQNLTLENRSKLNVTGVMDVDSFNEENVILETVMGILLIKGSGLKINKLNVDIGDLQVEGEINSLIYTNDSVSKGGFLSKLFK